MRLAPPPGAACVVPLLHASFHPSVLIRAGDYKYKRGTTGVLTKVVTSMPLEVVEESVQTMDTS